MVGAVSLDLEGGDEAVVALRAVRRRSSCRCPARASRGSPSRRARRGRSERPGSRAEDGQAGDGRAGEVAAGRAATCRPRAAPFTELATISPSKTAQRLDLARGGGGGGAARVARGRGGQRARRDDGAVRGIGEARAEGRVVGRRRDRAGLRAGLARDEHADRNRARRGACSRAGTAGSDPSRRAERADPNSATTDREPLPHRPRIISKDGGE